MFLQLFWWSMWGGAGGKQPQWAECMYWCLSCGKPMAACTAALFGFDERQVGALFEGFTVSGSIAGPSIVCLLLCFLSCLSMSGSARQILWATVVQWVPARAKVSAIGLFILCRLKLKVLLMGSLRVQTGVYYRAIELEVNGSWCYCFLIWCQRRRPRETLWSSTWPCMCLVCRMQELQGVSGGYCHCCQYRWSRVRPADMRANGRQLWVCCWWCYSAAFIWYLVQCHPWKVLWHVDVTWSTLPGRNQRFAPTLWASPVP